MDRMLEESTTTTNATFAVAVENIRFEHLGNAFGIGVARPRLSWQISATEHDWLQQAYQLEIDDFGAGFADRTGWIESGDSVLVPWPFAPLRSRQRGQVRVRVRGVDGSNSDWSRLTVIEAGLLQPDDWAAAFVTPGWDEDTSQPQPCPLLRREFTVRPGVAQARLYVTALGVYETQINGAVVGDHVMAPGWTSYDYRLRYQTFDVTALLREGRNAVGAILGDGWFRGRLGYHGGRRNIYGDRLALLAQLEIEYADGTSQRVATDASWRAATGPILGSDIYDGETYDARLEPPGWSAAGFDDSHWAGVRRIERDLATLVAPVGPPVRRIETVAPVAVFQSPSGHTLIDFGQNLVGRLRFTVNGPAGQIITLRHAEVLEHGELCTRPLRHAAATDRYTLAGRGPETWEPRFTFHGFRYAEVDGWPGEMTAGAIHAVVIHSDMERTGWFECSDSLVNRLHENVVWGMRGNFVDVPTDCPQRDERLGWTGDIQVFAPTASFLYDSAGFLQSWLADLAAEQEAAGGMVPFFVPNVMATPVAPAAAWGDAAVIVPWVLYQRFGDVGILAAQFDSMRAWVDRLVSVAGPNRLWEKGIQFGDWLDPKAPPERPGDARTAPYVVATAYFARSADLLAQAAGVLGCAAEAEQYAALAGEVRAAFAREYVTPAGRVVSDATTAYALALQFGLLPTAEQRQYAGQRLAALVRGSGYRISTGFVGTPLVCDALCEAGEVDAAFRLLMQRECPSWLYPVTMGATTIWERWDSMLPDGSINPGEMTSFNHYALGAVADWLHRVVAGLAPAAPGYRRIEIKPVPGGGLTAARARHRTPYGLAECAWQIDGGVMTVEVEIPANTSATVHLPGQNGDVLAVGSGRYHWSYPYQVAAPVYPALTLDSGLGALFDHPTAYPAVKKIMARHNREFADRMAGQTEVTLREAIAQNPNPERLQAQVEAVLTALG
jgi:alpha-L-rhamnosidase